MPAKPPSDFLWQRIGPLPHAYLCEGTGDCTCVVGYVETAARTGDVEELERVTGWAVRMLRGSKRRGMVNANMGDVATNEAMDGIGVETIRSADVRLAGDIEVLIQGKCGGAVP